MPRFPFSASDVPPGRAGELFTNSLRAQQRTTNRLFFVLFLLQWVAGVLLALWRSPWTWEGSQAYVHFHVWIAILFGAVIAALPMYLISRDPDAVTTRHAIAVAQMLVGALLIALSGGRIETHFHVFGSLAFLAFYRDPWVLVTATAVVLTDHIGRGILAPLTIYGTSDIGLWRTAEHAFWIGFEDVFLWIACVQSRRQLLGLAQQQTELEQINEKIESAVLMRTKELTAARDAALASTRLKGQFVANVSHELRTPMNGILGTTELLMLTSLSDEQRECATTVQRSAESLLALINEILDFSKMEAGRVHVVNQSFDLPELLASACAALTPLAEIKGLRMTCTIDRDVPVRITGDALRLRQILNNLLGNAVKFTERGGVDVRLSVVAPPGPAPRVRFTVADTGTGIPPELAPRLFEAFVQGDGTSTRRHEGTGLGLAIAKELTHLLGGELGFANRETGGAVFWLELPVTASPTSPAIDPAAPPPTGAEALPRRLSVLVAEDNPINQRLLVRMLEKLGQQATVAVDGVEAVEAARTSQFDLVLMDWQMPRMDGLSATAAIRALPGPRSRVPIVAVTANAMAGDQERCLAAGMDGFLSKPLRLAELAALLTRLTGASGAAECPVGSAATGGGLGVGLQSRPGRERCGEHGEQIPEGTEILPLHRGGECGLHPMVPRNVEGVHGIHGSRAGDGVGEAGAPPDHPLVVGLGVGEQRTDQRVVPGRRRGEPTEGEGIVDRLTVEGGQKTIRQVEVTGLGFTVQAQLAAHPGQPGGIVPFAERFEHGDRPRDGRLGVPINEGQQGLREPGQIPASDLRLLTEGVPAAAIDGAEDGGRAVGIEKGAGAVVDGLPGDGHVVGIHHPMDETDQHPARDQRRLPVRDGGE
jgi:two-component system sensor histidine kinase/response regulator